jgi:hypothetical protein
MNQPLIGERGSWSPWYRFSELENHPVPVEWKLGVYEIRATTEDHQPITIRRACADDADGLLYIGCGKLAYRVGYLLRISEPNPKHHHQFITVYLTYGLDRICPARFLEIRFRACDDFQVEERKLLYEYKARTGDIPPGNRRLDPFENPTGQPSSTDSCQALPESAPH